MRYLEGKFFLRSDMDYYRTGQVIKATKREALVQYEKMANSDADPSWAMPMEVVCHDELAHAETEFGKVWGFFNSREELDGYLNWMETPQQRGQWRWTSQASTLPSNGSAMMLETSEQHARLAEIYGRADPSLSREQVARRSMLARYHAMLAKAALRREALKVNPSRQTCGDQNADGSQLAFAGF